METQYEYEPHCFKHKRLVGWAKSFCCVCGLIDMNNPFATWAREKGCNYPDHPAYNRQRKQTR